MKCPICNKPTEREKHPSWPFCSVRCQLIDLGSWTSEEYRIESPEALSDNDLDDYSLEFEEAVLDSFRHKSSAT